MRNMDKLKLSAYEIIEVRKIADIESMGYILRHKKSGARVCVISNEDDNKVFSIGFRTPPEDETGVPHIIEHTTLCGSDKFPVKDPFVELAKGSLNTFLNAMTAHNERPEVILVGTGDKQIFLHPRIAAQLAREGIGLESMNTAAACRTRMVLESEGRRVWAWLWP